jgi:4-hydroxy-3-methylbut-2-en-1-yl diphosphate reductase
MRIEIDKYSGFCFGVTNAIKKAEESLKTNKPLYCLGQIVHNSIEEERLRKLGLISIDHKKLLDLKNKNVLIRAHGEPPSTYITAKHNKINLFDATCPVVIKLQDKIRLIHTEFPDAQILIFGKKGHAEVNGLVGQTDDKAIVISSISDLKNIGLGEKIYVFAQTTANKDEFLLVIEELKRLGELKNPQSEIQFFDTICPSVSNRIPKIKDFAQSHQVILFVSDPKSSNGKMLFEVCKKYNPKSYFVSEIKDVNPVWLEGVETVGISGATSTPLWLMQEFLQFISLNDD